MSEVQSNCKYVAEESSNSIKTRLAILEKPTLFNGVILSLLRTFLWSRNSSTAGGSTTARFISQRVASEPSKIFEVGSAEKRSNETFTLKDSLFSGDVVTGLLAATSGRQGGEPPVPMNPGLHLQIILSYKKCTAGSHDSTIEGQQNRKNVKTE